MDSRRQHPASHATAAVPVLHRRQVRFIGHVQGVGFRYTTMNVALQFDVRGYVRNMPDGSVEVVAEGSPSEIDRFIGAVRERMSAYIRKVESNNAPGTGEFAEFSIRH